LKREFVIGERASILKRFPSSHDVSSGSVGDGSSSTKDASDLIVLPGMDEIRHRVMLLVEKASTTASFSMLMPPSKRKTDRTQTTFCCIFVSYVASDFA